MLRQVMASALMACSHVCRGAGDVLAAVAAGVCDGDELMRRTRVAWDQADGHEPSYVLSGLMDWEAGVCALFPPGATIGVIGCGSGRDVIALARLGYVVDGVDASPRAIGLAREYLAQAGVEGRVYCGDIAEFVFPRSRYDAFLFSWFTYGYIPGADRRVRVLRRLWPRLDPTGCVIVTLRPFRGEGQRLLRIARLAGKLTLNPDRPVHGDIFFEKLSYEHRFARETIGNEARAAGFDIASYAEGQDVTVAVLRNAVSKPATGTC